MVDNRYATALVIGSVLSILATVYLSVAVGTQHWYQYRSPPAMGEANASELRVMQEEFMSSDFDEKTYSDTLFRLNGTLGLWWRCVLVPTHSHWYKEPGKGQAVTRELPYSHWCNMHEASHNVFTLTIAHTFLHSYFTPWHAVKY